MGIKPKTTGSGFNHGEKDENWEARTTDDLISRQDAVNALDKRFDDVPMELTTEILLLRKDLREVIPSAQPETHDKRTETHVCDYSLDEWCTDCKEYDTERNCCPRFNRVIREAVKEAQPVTIIESDESIKLQNSNDTISGEADET